MDMDWKKIVSAVAPALGTALGGPLAGTAINVLGQKLLGKPDASEDDIKDMILTASPDQLVELKKIDAGFKLSMREMQIDLERIGVDDRKSARNLARDNVWPQILLSVVYTLGYFGILVGLMYVAMRDQSLMLDSTVTAVLTTLVGALSAGIPTILKFWFGGSPQDRENMDRVYNSVPKIQ